jgi:DNA-binding transcriptional MerR regulator
VVDLLGVTRKTIRHYHKLGLLPEPERTETGYRLYSAADLFALQRIRQLQSIGFSLERIKSILTSKNPDALLQDTLVSIGRDMDAQIERLRMRRDQIERLLQQEITLQKISLPEGQPAAHQLIVDLFGELLEDLPAQDVEDDRRFWALLDAFHWPIEYQGAVEQGFRDLVKRPDITEKLAEMNLRYQALADCSPDDPMVRELAEDVVREGLYVRLDDLSALDPPVLSMLQEVVDQLTDPDASPSQRHLLVIIKELVSRQN